MLGPTRIPQAGTTRMLYPDFVLNLSAYLGKYVPFLPLRGLYRADRFCLQSFPVVLDETFGWFSAECETPRWSDFACARV